MKARKETLRRIQITLQKRRDTLRKQLAGEAIELRTSAHEVGDSIDAALDAEHQAVQSQLTTAESRELERVEHSLRRLARGEYGLCEACGGAIPFARLQAIPYATQCVKCQRQDDSTRRARSHGAARFVIETEIENGHTAET